MVDEKNCDGCCYNNNPYENLNCNRIVCCYLYERKGKFSECLINERSDKL